MIWYVRNTPVCLRTQHDRAPVCYSYLSTLQWAVDTANLDVAMFGPWDDLQSLKVTAQNHHVTPWCIGLLRDKETARRGERWRWHPVRIAWRVTWTALGLEPVSLQQTCHHTTALAYKHIRLVFRSRSHMSHDSLWLCLLHKRTRRTEIVLLLIHSLNSMGVASHRVGFEITECKSSQGYCLCISDMRHTLQT